MTKNTNNMLEESISAALDGEANELELQRVLKSIDQDDNARQMCQRYSLIRSAMKRDLAVGEFDAFAKVDLSAGIRDVIDNEAIGSIEKPSSWLKWRAGIGKTAIAATVAFGFVMGVQQYPYSGSSAGTPVLAASGVNSNATAPAEASAPAWFVQPELRTRTVSSEGKVRASAPSMYRHAAPAVVSGGAPVMNAEIEERINRMLFKHAQQSSSHSALGVIPFARVSKLEGKQD